MDPNACMTILFDALKEGDDTTAIDAVLDLEDWLMKGGCMPKVTREQLLMLLRTVNAKLILLRAVNAEA